MKKYTKAELHELVYCQLQNLNAMHDLLKLLKKQNELLEIAYKKLSDEVSDFKQEYYSNYRRRFK